MKLETFLLTSKIKKIFEIIKGNLNSTLKPSKLMIQNVLDILHKRKISELDEKTYRELVFMCEIYINEVDVELQPNVENFTLEVETIIKDWYSNCPRSLTFVSKVISAYREHIGEIVVDDK